MRVLLAGAGGQVGHRVHELLRGSGYSVRAISGRDLTKPGMAVGMAEGCSIVVSCAGASVALNAADRRPFHQVDPVIHQALLKETLRAGAYRFVYLSVYLDESYAHTAYVKAHESFVDSLRKATITSTVIRPTGFFSAFEDLVPMARKGFLPLVGNGLARTNPIDPQDVAELMVKYLHAGPADLACGGPDVLTRLEINRIVAQASGIPNPWMLKTPASLLRMQAKLLRYLHPRKAQLVEFFAEAATHDCVAPALGKRKMSDYFGVVPARLAVQAT